MNSKLLNTSDETFKTLLIKLSVPKIKSDIFDMAHISKYIYDVVLFMTAYYLHERYRSKRRCPFHGDLLKET